MTNPFENPFGFIIDLFFILYDGALALWNFLNYEITMIRSVSFGIFEFDLPLLNQLPETVIVYQIMGGTGLVVIMAIVFIKAITPFL